MILRSRPQNVGNEVRAKGLADVVVVATIVAVVVDAVVDLLQTLAELTSLPSLELGLHMALALLCRRALAIFFA
jgi:uncharacterized membrane protein